MAVAIKGNVISHYEPLEPRAASRTGLPEYLARRGFEVKTASFDGKPQPVVVGPQGNVFSEAAVFSGALSQDRHLAEYQRKMRASATSQYRSAFWRWPRYLAKANYNRDLAFSLLHGDHPAEAKALVEGIDTSGGYLVPPDFSSTIWRGIAEQSLLQFTTQRPTSADILTMPRFLPNASAPGFATNLGPAIPSVGETPHQTTPNPLFGALQIPIRRFRSILRVSRDLLMDSDNLALQLQDAFAADLGAAITRQILSGPDFDGLLTNPNIPSLSLNPAAGHTLSATSGDGWRALKSSLPEPYRQRAMVFMAGSTQSAFEIAAPAASTRPIAVRHDDVSGVYRFDEVALTTSAAMPAYPPAAGGVVLSYGDLSQFVVGIRADVSLTVVTESDASDYDEVDIVLLARCGGAVGTAAAFVNGTL